MIDPFYSNEPHSPLLIGVTLDEIPILIDTLQSLQDGKCQATVSAFDSDGEELDIVFTRLESP